MGATSRTELIEVVAFRKKVKGKHKVMLVKRVGSGIMLAIHKPEKLKGT